MSLPNLKDSLMSPEWLAEFMHNNYEVIAKEEKWETQKITRVPFNELPEHNKDTMLRVATLIIREFQERNKHILLLRREHAQKELDKIPAPEPSDFNKDMIRFVQKSSYWRGRLDELNEQLGEETK